MRILAVLTVRNEGAFLLEWLAHHRAVGFTDVLVFSNDCDDGTDAMLDRLADSGHLTHIRNDGPHPQGPQWAALRTASSHPLFAASDWAMVLDIDEFVNIHVGARRIPDLLAALPNATAIPLTWRMFGNAGVIPFTDTPIRRTFTKAAPAVLHWPWRASLFKTLFKVDGSYAKFGVHRPRSPDTERVADQRWFDGSGGELPRAFHKGRVMSALGTDNFQLAQLNHYALGAMHSYLVKCDRGRANRDASTFDMGYWVDRNFSDVNDASILDLDPFVQPLIEEFKSDPVLCGLHQQAVAWRHTRFADLMTDEPWRALFGRLLLTPASRALTADQARLIWQQPGN
jgi:Glycosyl transferase family 2